MKAWTGPLATKAQDLAESLWHTPAGKSCGNCLAPFNAENAPASIFGATKFFENGTWHRVVRFVCKKCNLDIRREGPSAAMVAAAELEIVGELLVPGPL